MYFDADLPWEPLERRPIPPWRGEEAGSVSHYNPLIGRAICERVAAGWSVRRLCRDPEMPDRATIGNWRARHADFAQAYRAAQQKARASDRMMDAHRRGGRGGRPLKASGKSLYTVEAAAAICERIACGETMLAITRERGAPKYGTVYQWLRTHPEFADAMAQARDVAVHYKFELMWEIALASTPETAAVDRLRIQTLQWQIAREAPHKYSQRLAGKAEAEPEDSFDLKAFMTWRHGEWDEAKREGRLRYEGWHRLIVLPKEAAEAGADLDAVAAVGAVREIRGA